MTSPTGKLGIEVVADVRQFARQATSDINKALRNVKLDVGPIQNQLGKIGDAGRNAFRELSASSEGIFDELRRDSGKAAEKVADDMEASGERVERSLGEVGDRGEREMDRLEREARDAGGSMLRNLSLTAAGIGAAFAAISIGRFFIDAAQDAEDLGSAIENTTQLIKTTGGTAKLTADQVRELSRALSLKIGVDSVEVQNAANVLLTFKAVSGDTFKTALGLAADLTGVFKTDLQGATLQLGKALQNPVKGVTALTRAGVDFTAAQREQIKGFVETNQLAKAQALILAEVAGQVEGVAEAGVDSTDQLKVAFQDLKREAGSALIGFIDDNAPRMIAILQTMEPVIATVGELLASAFEAALPFVEVLATSIRDNFAAVGPAIEPLADVFESVLSVLPGVIPPLVEITKELLPPLAAIVKDVAKALAPVIGQVIKLAGAVAAALLPALEPLGEILREVADALGESLLTILPPLADLFVELVRAVLPLLPILLGVVKAALPLIEVVADIAAAVLPLIGALAPLIKLLVFLVNVPLLALLPLLTLLGALLKPLTPLIELLAEGLTAILAPLEDLTPLIESFTSFLSNMDWARLGSEVGDVGDEISGSFGDAWGKVNEFFDALVTGLAAASGPLKPLVLLVKDLDTAIASLDVSDTLGDIAKAFADAWHKTDEFFDALVSGLAAVTGPLKPFVLLIKQLSDPFVAALGKGEEFFVRLRGWLTGTGPPSDKFVHKMWKVEGSQRDAAKGALAHADSLKVLGDALKAQTNPVFAFIRSQKAAKDAQREVTNALREFGRNSPQYREAVLNQASAQIDLASATGDAADATDASLIPALKQMRRDGQLSQDAFDELVGAINSSKKAADRLDGTRVRVSVKVAIDAALDKLASILNKIPKFHEGGLVPGLPGTETLAILKAGERVLPPGEDRRASELLAKAMEQANASLRAVGVPGAQATLEPTFMVMVEIDGQQLEGRITRVVDERDRTVTRRVRAGAGARR